MIGSKIVLSALPVKSGKALLISNPARPIAGQSFVPGTIAGPKVFQ